MEEPKSPFSEEITLYQWPASNHCDSIYARCTKIQRVLGLLKVPYKVADISLPSTNDKNKIETMVNPLMRKIPILQVGKNKFVEETAVIIDYLVQKVGYTGFQFKDERTMAQAYVLEQWVEHRLNWMVIYGRWVKDDNYRNLLSSVGDFKSRVNVRKSMDYTRERACEIIKSTDVGKLSETEYRSILKDAFHHLDALLIDTTFLFGSELKLADLSVFMCLQAFIDPAMEIEREMLTNLPRLQIWLHEVDEATKTPYTRSPKVEIG